MFICNPAMEAFLEAYRLELHLLYTEMGPLSWDAHTGMEEHLGAITGTHTSERQTLVYRGFLGPI